MKSRMIAISFICAICAGCATIHQRLIEHPKRTVRYPAVAGEAVGWIAGFPVALVCLPVTLPIYAFNQDSENARWAPLYPWNATRGAFTALIGGGPWLIFGWWGVPKYEPKAVVNTKARWPMGTYVETPTGSMVVGDSSSKTGEFKKEE